MQITAYAPQIIKTHQKITKVIDGDGLCVIDMFGKNEIEIRFLGIDAPEIKRSKNNFTAFQAQEHPGKTG